MFSDCESMGSSPWEGWLRKQSSTSGRSGSLGHLEREGRAKTEPGRGDHVCSGSQRAWSPPSVLLHLTGAKVSEGSVECISDDHLLQRRPS